MMVVARKWQCEGAFEQGWRLLDLHLVTLYLRFMAAQKNPVSVESVRAAAQRCPVIDNHAHNLLRYDRLRDHPLETATTEARGAALADAKASLAHLRASKQLRELYGCAADASWDAVLKARDKQLATDPAELYRKCLAGTECILMDDGLSGTGATFPFHWHDQFTPSPTKRVVRIETVAENLIADILAKISEDDARAEGFLADTWYEFTVGFERALTVAVEDPAVAAFKSVVCYRSGLHVDTDLDVVAEDAERAFDRYLTRALRHREFRINKKCINDYLVLKTCDVLASVLETTTWTKPLQFHTGLGDSDICLRRSNPAYLQTLIEKYEMVPFVLLHSAYPYTREAGYLATVFANVYLDVGEVFPMLSRDGEISVLRQSLELVPGTKVLWSTDGHFLPETYWLANKQFREALEEAPEIELSTIPLAIRDRAESDVYDVSILDGFLDQNPSIEYVYVQWVDYMGTLRSRVLPVGEFHHLILSDNRLGISSGNKGTLQNDFVTSVANTTGQIYIEPDLTTLRRTHPKDPLPSATVMAFWTDADGKRLPECPRRSLKERCDDLSSFELHLLVGFEIEVTFLKRSSSTPSTYAPLTTNHAWGTVTPEQWSTAFPLLAEISSALSTMGIHVKQFHSESGPGQYEFVLGPQEPLAAVDTLVQARTAIAQIAHSHGLRATLHPQPFPGGAGTAAHAHVSLHSRTSLEKARKDEMSFWAGVLNHLESVCAFTMPEEVSYERVADDHWTGGTWVAWGTENRETPLRRVKEGRWEVRCLDGMANMYLALGAVIAAGFIGVDHPDYSTEMKDTPFNPSKMSEQQRSEYGITRRLPASLAEALDRLETDYKFKQLLGGDMVDRYIVMKREEQKMLMDMPEDERRGWLIERY
ncbi:developmental protein-like protein fluG [Lineolata rhizophorae]|uniref:Developmental protein-like protein fluG n=1 Tax=Lineolata rhizophorae TaxID=578093 RepID=A0A6A6P6X9_9PEZI|nr:developmental protein-like protein fluG [Lineolata rhizophorae]